LEVIDIYTINLHFRYACGAPAHRTWPVPREKKSVTGQNSMSLK